jgi:hypothetical protein
MNFLPSEAAQNHPETAATLDSRRALALQVRRQFLCCDAKHPRKMTGPVRI